MKQQTLAQLRAENTALRARLTELETRLAEQQPVAQTQDGAIPSLKNIANQAFVTGQRKDGTEFQAEATLAKSPATPADQHSMTAFLRDITTHGQAEKALQEAYANLEQQVKEHTTDLAVVNARLQQETEERRQVEEALHRSEHQFRQLFEEMLSGFALHEIICDTHGQPVDYRFLTVNPAFEAMTGLKARDIIGRCIREVLPQIEDYWVENYGRVALSNEPFQFENYSEALGKYFEGRAFCPEKGKFAVLFHDVTERKRSEEAQRLDEARLEALLRFGTMTAASEKDITNFALEEGVRLTNSKIGYLHFINDDQISLQLFTWSKDVYKQCYTEKIDHYPLEQAGVWVDCVRQRRHIIHNDYQQLPDRKGYPEGHIPVVRHLSVPVLDGDRVVAVAGVGNKTEPYDEKDARQLSLFMNGMWALLQRKRAELAVQQLNTELEQRVQERTIEMEDLYNHAPCGYHSLDPDGLIIRINNTELHCLGYTREELVGHKHFTELLTENCRKLFQQNYLLLKEHGWVKDLELEMIRKNGTTLPVLLSETAVRDTADRHVMSRSTVFNITDRKRAEEARRQSEERFRRYFELSLIGMAVTSPDKGWVEVNDHLCEILGYSRAELSRLTWVDVTHPDDLAAAIDCFSRVMAGGTDGYSLDKRFIRKDGQIIYASISAKCLRRADGSVDCFLALVQDITSRKQAEAALRHSRDELSAANAALAKAARLKDEFLASMSHELRTPLTGILNLSEALQEQVYGPMNEKQLKSLHTIEESGRHLLELINDILDLSKIEAGQFDLQLEKCIVGDVCRSSLQLIKGMANKKRQQISFTINPPAIDLCTDARRLKQMLFNLLGNAVKFTPVGGNIGLQVEGAAEARVIRFSVWDTGIGIATEDLPQLFRPFTQLDSRLARQYSGTGLGLSLVQRMADLHGGGVSVESTPGQGSRFTITLPWNTAAPTVSAPIQNRDKQNTPRQRLPGERPAGEAGRLQPQILLVDDNETNISTFADYLQSKGYRVILARQGSEALQAVQLMKPDLILLDIQMPGMDGLEVMQRIRRDANVKVAATPIIALTALAMPGDRERCLATGANDYLGKPVNFHQLIQVIETQLVQP